MQTSDTTYLREHQKREEDSSHLIFLLNRTVCKNFSFHVSNISKKQNVVKGVLAVKPKLLIVHGNISYEYFYRSKIDTPLNQNNFQQHTERVYLNLLYKEKYPLKIGFTARESNSPWFRDFFDVNFQFDPGAFRRDLKEEMIKRISASMLHSKSLDSLEDLLNGYKKLFRKYKAELSNSSTLQKIIEAKEQEYWHNRKDMNLDNNDYSFEKFSAAFSKYKFGNYGIPKENEERSQGDILNKIGSQQSKIDSLAQKIQSLEAAKDSVGNAVKAKLTSIKQKIYKENDKRKLLKIAEDEGINVDSSRLSNKLLAIKNLSIGKSVLNYTELTAQNISITGINVEYNPSTYFAFAAGKTSYNFRDFFNRDIRHRNQYLFLGRFGIGDINRKAVIFTVFQGKKDQYGYQIPDSINTSVSLLGYSIEGLYKIGNHTSLSAEVAKSTKSSYGVNGLDRKQVGSLIRYSDNSNMGVNIKARTIIDETGTSLSGFYRRTGQDFQSFSLFTYNTNQTSWQARLDQPFLKRRLNLTAMLRQNDFVNPFTIKTYRSSTIFGTFLVNLRIPKYPSLTFGYYPGSQLYVIDKDKVSENVYYLLNGSLFYYYRIGATNMNSSFVFNRYFNKATDSGFVMDKGVSYYASQTAFLKKFQLQGGYSFTRQTDLSYFMLESDLDYSPSGTFKIGGGIKYNKTNVGAVYYGVRAQLSFGIRSLGGLQFQYEKSYLPTLNQTLYPVEFGRVSWYKNF